MQRRNFMLILHRGTFATPKMQNTPPPHPPLSPFFRGNEICWWSWLVSHGWRRSILALLRHQSMSQATRGGKPVIFHLCQSLVFFNRACFSFPRRVCSQKVCDVTLLGSSNSFVRLVPNQTFSRADIKFFLCLWELLGTLFLKCF